MKDSGDYISREALVARIRYHIEKAKFCGLENHEATQLLAEAAAALEQIPAADVRPKWISVEERLPELHDAEYLDEVTGELIRYKESAPILIWLAKGGFMDIGVYEKSESVDDFCYQGVPHTVTYWMPLPSAPEEKADA